MKWLETPGMDLEHILYAMWEQKKDSFFWEQLTIQKQGVLRKSYIKNASKKLYLRE